MDHSPQHGTHAAGTLNWELPEYLSRELNDLGRREGATLFMTLLAGFHLLLSSYTGQDDIAIGTPVAGRRSLETEPLIGFFVNTLVLRSRFSAEMSFREFLSQVRETTVQAYAHQDVPFEKLVEELRPKRDTGLTPFFQVMFILQNTPHGELALPGLKLSEVEIEAETAKFYI